MLATHPEHRCHHHHLGFHFTCQPPWHFFGWFWEANAPAMQAVARGTGTPLRVGERRYQGADGTPLVEVWVHEHVTSLEDFWENWDAHEER